MGGLKKSRGRLKPGCHISGKYLEKSFRAQFLWKLAGFLGYFLSFSCRKSGKIKKNWEKLSPFFRGVLIAQKRFIIQSRLLVHNNQNALLNMGFHSGFSRKPLFFAEKAENGNARFPVKTGLWLLLTPKTMENDVQGRVMTFFTPYSHTPPKFLDNYITPPPQFFSTNFR